MKKKDYKKQTSKQRQETEDQRVRWIQRTPVVTTRGGAVFTHKELAQRNRQASKGKSNQAAYAGIESNRKAKALKNKKIEWRRRLAEKRTALIKAGKWIKGWPRWAEPPK